MNTNKRNNIGVSLIDSACKEDAKELAIEISEIALDEIINNEDLEKLPIFGWMAKAVNITSSIRERLFLKKVAEFLSGATIVSENEKLKFQQRIQENDEFARSVGENLLLLIERHDSYEKSHLLGKIFALFIKDKIDYQMFQRLSLAIDRAMIDDLLKLEEYYQDVKSYDINAGKPFSDHLPDNISQQLHSAGLLIAEEYTETIYKTNELGEAIISVQTQNL